MIVLLASVIGLSQSQAADFETISKTCKLSDSKIQAFDRGLNLHKKLSKNPFTEIKCKKECTNHNQKLPAGTPIE